MGCDCCDQWDGEMCSASYSYRKVFCGVGTGSKFTPPKKKRKKKNVKPKKHKKK